MFEVRNYSTSDIELDGKKVPHGASVLFEIIKNTPLMSSLISKGKISVVLKDVTKPTSTKNINPPIKEDVVTNIETTVEEDTNTNITTTTSKKRKNKDNDSEVENSKSTKGDMNNATD